MTGEPDAQTRELLVELTPPGSPTIAQLPLEMARGALRMLSAAKGIVVHAPIRVRGDFIAADSEGPRIGVRIYSPDAPPTAAGLPAVLFLHGGGFILGDLDTHDSIARFFCRNAPCVVVSVDYRLAPEHTFPAAIEDCMRAARWLRANARSLGASPRCIIVAGDSAGGHLAAIVAQLDARQREVEFASQVLLYPYLATRPHEGFDSRERFGGGDFFLTCADIEHFRIQYLGTAEAIEDPRFSPLACESLEDVAPALIVTAGLDPLRDEAEHYAARLRAAGVAVDYRCFEGTIHGFASFAGCIDAGRAALELVCDSIRQSPQA
jgi:acetyl esterase